MAGICLLGFAVFLWNIGSRDAKQAANEVRVAHQRQVQANHIRLQLASLERRHRAVSEDRARPLTDWAPQAIANLERSAPGNGVVLGTVSIGQFALGGQGTDIETAARPVSGWSGIRKIPVTMKGTWRELAGFRGWLKIAREEDVSVRKVTIAKSTFTVNFSVYGR